LNATKCIVYISSDKKVRIILFILDFKIFFVVFLLTIKDKTHISLTFDILHIRQGSFTRKVRTNFTLKIIVSKFERKRNMCLIFYRK
jgi:hypothetical protein